MVGTTQVAMVAGEGLASLSAAEQNKGQLKTINDGTLIAQRTAQLERVKMEKGC